MTKCKKLNQIIAFFAALLIVASCFPISVMGLGGSDNGAVPPDLITASIAGVDGEREIRTNYRRYAYFDITLSAPVPEDAEITVYYRTRNESAIPTKRNEKGEIIDQQDYDPVDDKITFYAGETTARRSVYTFMQDSGAIDYTGSAAKGISQRRSFEVSIYKIEYRNCNAAIDKNASRVRVYLYANWTYRVTTLADIYKETGKRANGYTDNAKIVDSYGNELSFDNQLFYTAYNETNASFELYENKFKVVVYEPYYYSHNDFGGIATYEFLHARDANGELLAHAYIGFTSVGTDSWTLITSCSDDNYVTLYAQNDNYDWVTVERLHSDYAEPDMHWVSGKDIKGVFLNTQKGNKWLRSVTSSTTDSKSYLVYDANTILFRAPSLDCRVEVENKCWLDAKDFDVQFRQMMVDDICPTVVSYVYDDVELTGEDTARISVRFNEKVQISQDPKAPLPQLHVRTTTATPRDLYFQYAGGAGTDTLWFEFKMSDYTYGDSVRFLRLVGLTGDIFDLSMNRAQLSNGSYGFVFGSNFVDLEGTEPESDVKFPFEYDFSKPYLSVKGGSETSLTKPSTQKTVKLELTNCNVANIRYAWSKEKTDKEYFIDYTNSTTFQSSQSNTIPSAADMTGVYYLYVEASSPMLVRQKFRFGPYVFDNKAPAVSEITMNEDTLKSKTFLFTAKDDTFTVSDEEKYPVSITDISMVYYESRTKQVKPEYTGEIKIVENGVIKQSGATFDTTAPETFVQFTLTAEDFGLEPGGYGYYYGAIQVKDELGNTYESPQKQYRYDMRNLFYTAISVTEGDLIENTAYDERVYSTKEKGLTLQAVLTEESNDDKGGIWSIYSIRHNGNDVTGSDWYSFDPEKVILTISPSVPSGNVEVIFGLTKDGTQKVSTSYVFYFVKGDEHTENEKILSGNTLLINKVYQLNTPYYYLEKGEEGTVFQKKEVYGNAKGKPTFSSKEEALKYVSFNELQSMYVERISENAAAQLNSQTGDTNYSKALGEKTTAKEGQLWIRYKRISWSEPSGLTDLSGWCYYYYDEPGTSELIDDERFTLVLNNALTGVSNYIVSHGETVWLYGIPTLDVSQTHVETEAFTTTKAGSTMRTPAVYYGDGALYKNTVFKNDTDIWLVTNYAIRANKFTRIFLASAYDGTVSTNYKEYAIRDGMTFGELENENGNGLITGTYAVREIDQNGMSEYFVFIDKDAPIVMIDLTSQAADGTRSQTSLKANRTESNGHVYSARSAVIREIMGSELDTYAYVCVKKYRTGDILNVYHAADLNDGVKLEDGYYLIEVSDRSGNSYSFSLRISDDDLLPQFVKDGTKFSIICDNRSGDQIVQYVIKRNGIDLHVSFTEKYTSSQSGYYEVYIEDIYGNVYEHVFDFTKDPPSVTWYYLPEGETRPVPYTDECKEMTMQALSESTNIINTSRDLSFSFSGDYGYTVEEGEFTEKYDHYTGLTTVSLKPTGSMKVTIFYEDTPDVAITYFCSFDNVAPTVKVTYMAKTFRTEDFMNVNPAEHNVGDPVVPERISFYEDVSTEKPVYTGDTVSALIYTVAVSDTSGVDRVEIYLNDAYVTTYTGTAGRLKDFTLGKYGDYKIVAYDIFGNKTTFSFCNKQQSDTRYLIDGKEIPYLFGTTFTDGVCDQTEYGGNDQEIVIDKDNEIAYLIKIGGQSYFYAYGLENGNLYPRFYTIDSHEDQDTGESVKEIKRSSGECVMTASDEGTKTIVSEEYFTVTAWFADGALHLRTTCNSQDELTVMTRVMDTTVAEPFFVQTVLSNKRPAVEFKVGEGKKTAIPTPDPVNADHAVLKINGDFTLAFDQLEAEKIKSIRIGYSTSSLPGDAFEILTGGGLKDLWLVSGDRTIGDEGFDRLTDEQKLYYATASNGYYEVTVENIYGNQVVYTVIRADGFLVNAVATYQDTQKSYYDFQYEEKIFSNNLIEYTIFYNDDGDSALSGSFRFALEKDGKTVREGDLKNGFVLTIEEDGDYVLTVLDEFGNSKTLLAQIKKTNLEVNKDAIFGFNENALLKDYGYTNDFLSINADVILKEGYNFISVAKMGEEPTVLYDLISQNKKELAAAELKNCIGKGGDGEYEIVFRDRFGNKLVTTVNIRFTPTFSLQRITRNSIVPEDFDLELACRSGIAANESILFATTATTYELKLDGKPYAITRPLSFRTANEETTYVYTVDYVDEYGFRYTFTARLYRGTPKLELNTDIRVTVDSGNKCTKDNVSYLFDEKDAVCVYYKDDSEVGIPYRSGARLLLDGKYVFEVTDSAGNVNFDTVIKDSVCNYEFIEVHTDANVVKGAITNESRVKFVALGNDDVKIVKAVLNGEEIESFDSDAITANGKWEFILQDRLGNVDYFTFTLVSHALSQLDYTSTDGFVVVDAWYTGEGGVRTNYLSYVDNLGDVQSHFRITNDGTYEFKMSNIYTKQVLTFTVTLNNVVPDVALVGCEEGQKTINNVTLKGVKDGDTIDVYKDGVLIKSVQYTDGATVPVISEGGNYRIVITSVSGIPKTLTFERKYIANTAASVMIIIVIAMAFTALMIGLICRTRLKTDE